MAATDKDTIYIDIDDEITGIIDKLKASDGKIVALVLPKRAAVFQSIVNMKLLKRAADSSKKNLVLITSEAGLLPLAGAAGVHVAKTLTSKPQIPSGPDIDDDSEEEVGEDVEDVTEELAADKDKTVGELAGVAAGAGILAAAGRKDDVETLTLDNDDLPVDGESPAKKSFAPPKKDKKLKVPDFDRFRLMLIGGGCALALLIFGLIFANNVLPKATILIKTDASAVNVNTALNLSTTATELSLSDNTIPAKRAEQKKTYTETASATGQENKGDKASGSVTMTARKCGGNPFATPADVAAGTGLSNDGQTYITQELASFHGIGTDGSGCFLYAANGHIDIIAQNGGAKYNVSSTDFTVSGRSDVRASGSASGGTDNIVTVVTQTDINTAKAKINLDDPEIKSNLAKDLEKGNYYAITDTFSTGEPVVTTSVNAGDTANNVTVTEVVTYSMFGVNQSDLETVVDNEVKKQIDTDKQKITDRGLDSATFNVDSSSTTGAKVTMSTTATAGPELDIATIKQDAAGLKPGPIKDKLRTNPDVTSVEVKLSPFWVSSVPKDTSKIKVVIAKPSASKSSNSDASSQ